MDQGAKTKTGGAAKGGRRVVIRPAAAPDAGPIVALLRAFMAEENKAAGEPVSAQRLASWITGPDAICQMVLAEYQGSLVGYIAFYPIFSLFKGSPVMLVENLYVAPEARGGGIGQRLVAAAAADACHRGFARLELNIRTDSETARAFYQRLGFSAPGESVYRIEDAALTALAADGN